MPDNLPNTQTPQSPAFPAGPPVAPPEKIGFDVEKQSEPAPVLNPMTPITEVKIDPVPLPSVSAVAVNPTPVASPAIAFGAGGPALENPVAPPVVSPNPPVGGVGGPPAVSFAEEPNVKPPSGPSASSQEKKGKKGGGGKKLVAGIVALVVLVAALGAGLYMLGVPGFGELRRKANYVQDSGDCSGGTCTCVSATCATGRVVNGNALGDKTNCYVVSQHCDANDAAGCHENPNTSFGGSTSLGGFSCGTEQIDMGCEGPSGVETVGHTSTYYDTSCNQPEPSATPTTAETNKGCSRECSDSSECDASISLTCQDPGGRPKICWGDVCEPTPTPTPPEPTATPMPSAGNPQCVSASINGTPQGDVTVTSGSDVSLSSTATEPADAFMFGANNLDHLVGGLPQPICVTSGSDNDGDSSPYVGSCPSGTHTLVFRDINSGVYKTTATISVPYARIFVPDANNNNQIPSKVQFNAYFRDVARNGSTSSGNSACEVKANTAIVVATATPVPLQCIDVRAQTFERIPFGTARWVDVPNNDLAAVAHPGDNVRFVARVSLSTPGVTFQITSGSGAAQTLAGSLLPDSDTTDQISEYGVEYTIPSAGSLTVDATVN